MVERRYETLGETVYEETLSNGLRILVNKRRDYEKKFAFFATRYGGLDMRFRYGGAWRETPAGVAHFLEHKLFETEEGNTLQIMSEQGADPNAFTSFDLTGYFFQCTEKFEENLRLLLSFVSKPYFTPESVAKEQGIIGQEIAMGEDEAHSEVFYDLLGCLYHGHPIRTHIAGTAASIAQITPEVLYLCHDAFYAPSNMVLTVVGDVDPERVIQIAREIVTALGKEPPERDHGPEEPDEPVRKENRRTMAVSAPLFQLGFKLPPAPGGREGLRAQIVGDLAGDILMGDASPLYARLYDDGLLTREFSYGYERYPGAAFFVAGGESRDPQAVKEAVLEEAARIAREGIDPARFRRVKRAAYGSAVNGLNSFEETAIDMAESCLQGCGYFDFPELYREITVQEVERFIAEGFAESRAALAVILPGGEEK